jgi:putative FmdB family regulatory protein
MPTYEYKCLKCERRFEVFQSISDTPIKTCEVCKGQVKRLIGRGAGFIFKGSGFYCTDYRSESYQKAAKTEKEPAPAPAPSSVAKTESSAKTTPATKE